jgi:hypothetical protein
MSLANAFVGADVRYRAHIMHATWGHLEAKRGEVQPGWFVFSIAAYEGTHVILDSDWGELPDSPGLYTAMQDYISQHGERGVVTRLEGHVRRFKNGSYQIGGKRRVVRVKPIGGAR